MAGGLECRRVALDLETGVDGVGGVGFYRIDPKTLRKPAKFKVLLAIFPDQRAR